MSDVDFERRLAEELRRMADAGVRPVDAHATALDVVRRGRAAGAERRAGWPGRRTALLVAATLTTIGLLGSLAIGRQPIEPAPPTVSPSAPSAVVGEALQGIWLGGPRAVPDWTGQRPDNAMFTVREQTVSFLMRSGDAGTSSFASAASLTDGELILTTNTRGQGCADGAVGSYDWAVSAGGNVLEVTAIGDDCFARTTALAGTWYRMGCVARNAFCLGDLDAGEYRSWNFDASVGNEVLWHPPFGALTYRVPAGWTNSRDYGAGYYLEPTEWYHELLERVFRDYGDRDLGHGIYVLSHPVPAVQADDCSLEADPAAGRTATDLVTWLSTHPGLSVERLPPIAVDGRAAEVLDLAVASSWTKTCPDSAGDPFVGLLVNGKAAAGFYFWGLQAPARSRYIVVDMGDGTPLLIEIAAEDSAALDQLLPAAMDVIETFRFTPSSE